MSTNKVVIILGRYSLVDRVELLAGGVGLNGYEVVFETVFVTVKCLVASDPSEGTFQRTTLDQVSAAGSRLQSWRIDVAVVDEN